MKRSTDKCTVAYISGSFPARTETFVYREFLELRRRGWRVVPCALRRGEECSSPLLGGLREETQVAYGDSAQKVMALVMAEAARSPGRVLAVAMMAARDALSLCRPGRFSDAGKVLPQAVIAIALARRLRSQRVEHVHCHFAHAPTTVGMYMARHLGVTFSFTGHAVDIFKHKALLKHKLRRAAFIACISEYHKEYYASFCAGVVARCRVIRCGVDLAEWPTNSAPSRPMSSGELRILTVARLIPKKGIDLLVEAVAGLRDEGIPATLVVAGDGPLRGALQARVDVLGLRGQVRFVGAVENEEIPRLMKGADVFALPCRHDETGDRDGIPVAAMEAMASELPVVLGDLPSIRDLVEDGVSGLLVGNDAVASLVLGLGRLAREPGLRQRLAAAGRRRVEEEFSLQQNVSRLEEALVAALTERQSSRGSPRPPEP